ncbi:MAG: hypothetical protein LQ345_007375 [Seirophora villosa]|nr:MAG: hypothetical protein LQ345_007375 [Seirophora villosa]
MIRILVKMVVIEPRVFVDALEAYSTAPLTLEMNRTVQHGFYNGTYARFGDPQVTVTIHDRPEFHGKSHYDLRNLLDSEGMKDDFIVVDETTPDLDALWYVTSTGYSKLQAKTEKPGDVVHYPDEDFTLWHVHVRTPDMPLNVFGWREGCHPFSQALAQNDYLNPYDPHDPQDRLLKSNIDWTNPEITGSVWGPAEITAISGTEVEWSTDKALCQQALPTATICARLTVEAATRSGLLQAWFYQGRIIPPGGEVFLQAPYDTRSPVWRTGYPDERASRIGSSYFKDRFGPRLRPEARPSRKDVLRLSSATQRAHQSISHNACRRVDSNRSSQ